MQRTSEGEEEMVYRQEHEKADWTSDHTVGFPSHSLTVRQKLAPVPLSTHEDHPTESDGHD